MRRLVDFTLVFVCTGLITASATSGPSSACVQCICGVESGTPGKPGCGKIIGDKRCGKGCIWDINSCSCGPYQIKQPYFTDCSRFTTLPIKDWRNCSIDESCATSCAAAYLSHYGPTCTHKQSNITCEEYGGIHNGGPRGCDSPATTGYRQKIKNCCGTSFCDNNKLRQFLNKQEHHKDKNTVYKQ